LGWKREALKARVGDLFAFINTELLPYLHRLDTLPDGRPNLLATPRQRVIGRIMTAVERVRVDSETDFANILDLVHQISIDHIDDRHFFTLSQVYEDLLLKMGEKNSDGGQFFTPREVVRAMVHTLAPQPGETIYDPCCGTGGFLAQAYEQMADKLGDQPAATALEGLKHDSFFGRERRTWSSRLRWPIWCSTASTSPTCGTATRSPGADLRRAVRGGPGHLRRDPDQPALRRQGGQGRAEELQLREQLDPGAVHAAHPEGAQARPGRQARRALRGGAG
jgi:hypothetical protein